MKERRTLIRAIAAEHDAYLSKHPNAAKWLAEREEAPLFTPPDVGRWGHTTEWLQAGGTHE